MIQIAELKSQLAHTSDQIQVLNKKVIQVSEQENEWKEKYRKLKNDYKKLKLDSKLENFDSLEKVKNELSQEKVISQIVLSKIKMIQDKCNLFFNQNSIYFANEF